MVSGGTVDADAANGMRLRVALRLSHGKSRLVVVIHEVHDSACHMSVRADTEDVLQPLKFDVRVETYRKSVY